jgi:uncharacterized lipoprotein YmbA
MRALVLLVALVLAGCSTSGSTVSTLECDVGITSACTPSPGAAATPSPG